MNKLLDHKFVFFGGKGGVGKTSLASALAVYAADRGTKTLVISTDPAHSLADCLDQEIGGDVVPVRQCPNLWALEIDSEKAAAEFGNFLMKQDVGDDTGMLSQFLGGEDLSGLSPPGTDETVAFIKLMEFVDNPQQFELIIFDTAPTGHTLRLLSLPDLMDTWLYKMIKLRQRLGSVLGAFKKILSRGNPQDTDVREVLENMRKRVETARSHLQNPSETEFVPVTIPTLMSVWETERLIMALREYKIHAAHLFVNQLNPPSDSCKHCQYRNVQQNKIVTRIEDLYRGELVLSTIEMSTEEIRGIELLRKFGRAIYSSVDKAGNT